jgi:hypothetical protein
VRRQPGARWKLEDVVISRGMVIIHISGLNGLRNSRIPSNETRIFNEVLSSERIGHGVAELPAVWNSQQFADCQSR